MSLKPGRAAGTERGAGRLRRSLAALAVAGAAAAVAAAPAAAAPTDGRAWEFVSALESEGRNLHYAWGWASGDAAFYLNQEMPSHVVISSRTEGGWRQRLAPGTYPGQLTQLLWANEDMSRVVTMDDSAIGDGTMRPEGIFLHEGGRVTRIASWGYDFDVPKGGFLLAASDDVRTLYFYANNDDLFPTPPTSTRLYRWRDGHAEPVVIDHPSYHACPSVATLGGSDFPSKNGVGRTYRSNMQTGVSADGETVVVHARNCTDEARRYIFGRLYHLRDGRATALTEPVDPTRDAEPRFIGMSRDGSRVFFRSVAALVPGDPEGPDFYAWAAGSGIQRVTGDPAIAPDSVLYGDPIVSPDGSTAYFVMRSAAAPITYDLYAWRDGRVRHLTRLAGPMSIDGDNDTSPTDVTYDGSALVVIGTRLIDGIDTTQVYRFGLDGSATCVSCVDGRAVAPSVLSSLPRFGAAGWPAPRISRDGSTIAFETAGALVPQDVNGRRDVYVWRDGRISLVSSGTAGGDAAAAGMSWDGDTVFFVAWDAFVPGTTDPYRKMYAARVGGGFPLPQPPLPCGDSCQGPLPPAPFLPLPGTASFEGRGNLAEPPTLTVRAIGAVAQRRLARGGAVTVVARSSVAATVRAGMRVRLGRRWVRVDRGAQRLERAGSARIRLALSRRARRHLARRGALRVRITVASSAVDGQRRAGFVVRRAQRRRGAARRRARESQVSMTTSASGGASEGRGDA